MTAHYTNILKRINFVLKLFYVKMIFFIDPTLYLELKEAL